MCFQSTELDDITEPARSLKVNTARVSQAFPNVSEEVKSFLAWELHAALQSQYNPLDT